MERKFDLESRLITFASEVISFRDPMISSKGANHISNQLLRSGASPALNEGEVHPGESKRDFIH